MKNDNLTFKPDAENYKENSDSYLGYLEPDTNKLIWFLIYEFENTKTSIVSSLVTE
jgi:hypothetical protein